MTTTLDGDRFHVDFEHDLEWRLYAWGHYERHVQRYLTASVTDGGSAIDVGANIGIHTIPLARAVGPSGLVVAVEANPSVADRLEGNLALNCLTNVRVVRAAASSDSDQSVILNSTPPGSRSHGQASMLPLSHLTPTTVSVPTVAIDDLELPGVQVIKIDVEGAEWGVLQGAMRTIERDKPVLIFEYNRTYAPQTFDEFRKMILVNMGYESLWEVPDPGGRIWISQRSLRDIRSSDPVHQNANVVAKA